MAGIITGPTGAPIPAYTPRSAQDYTNLYQTMAQQSSGGMSNADIVKNAAASGYTAGDIEEAYKNARPDLFAQTDQIMSNVNAGNTAANANDPKFQALDKMESYVGGLYGNTSPSTGGGIVASPAASSTSGGATATTIGPATKWNITPDQTVQGRISSIINPNDPLMTQARTQADEQSNARGLVNSSIAVSAGEDAMYKAATPIAEADAATAAKAAGYNADMTNQIAVKNADMQNQMAQANLAANTQRYGVDVNAKTQLQTAGITAETQRAVASLNADSQQKIAQLDATTRTQVQQLQNQNQTLLSTNQQASQAFNQYVAAAANIENNPNLDAANKNAAMQALWQTTQAQLTVLAHVSGLDLTSMLDMTAFTPPAPAPTAAPSAPTPSGTNSDAAAPTNT